MSLLIYLLTIVSAVSLCVVAFLLVSAGDFARFKTIHGPKQRASILPLFSKYGDLISSPQELDFHLSGLKARLKEKYNELDGFKQKISHRVESLHKFENYRRGCYAMQEGLVQVEQECNELQEKIEYYRKIQARIQEDFFPGTGVMGDADWMQPATRSLT